MGLGVAAVLATLAPPALGGTPAREGAKLAPAVRAALDAGRNQRVLVLFRGEAEPALEPGLSRVQGIARVRRALERLDERERGVLLLRYGIDGGEPRTLEEIARQLGLTRERVRQIEKQALERLAVMRELDALRDAA